MGDSYYSFNRIKQTKYLICIFGWILKNANTLIFIQPSIKFFLGGGHKKNHLDSNIS